ncbi:transglycosylase domain-containing protein [Pseudahrensia aquimaris]|uniref:peptidoglycan glycosyltransferase n=1 Tax=Pseudahrensia aquimaris TaxID=744461 RepID=A0ABW3FE91_9HYPH
MRDPFAPKKRWNGSNWLLSFDSTIDDALYRFKNSGGEMWESLTIFFRRFRVKGFKRVLTEVACEGLTLGFVGLMLLLALAKPAFEETEKNWRSQQEYSVLFLDRFGNEIGRRGVLHNDAEAVDALPDHFVKAVLATEDRRFFEHIGIDFFGLVRAMIENARANSVVQGGSTITQQLAKNLFLTNERSLERKIKEAFLALWLEYNLTKKEILKTYLDRTYMGGGTIGAAAAAEFYFGKNIKDVDLAEGAMLAGLYKAPSKYAPHLNLPAARARANEVLTNMVQADFMTEGQVIIARRKPASVVERAKIDSPDYFLDYAFEQVKDLAIGFPTNTLIAKTTLDPSLQQAADEAVQYHLRQYGREFRANQSAMVVIENGGAVRAIVGGRDYGESQYNRATNGRRQPGSSIKPYVYAIAMDNGYSPTTRVNGGSVTIRGWTPRNYNGRVFGRVDMTTALVKSINTVPVRIAHQLGRGKIVRLMADMGVESPITAEPAMPLGTSDMTVMDQATGYGVFMSGGMQTNRHTILQITDSAGKVLYDFAKQAPKPKRVLSEKATEGMNIMLSQVPEWGTARRAKLAGIKTAGKTGTTQSYRDAWFVGYTGNYTAAVWFGNDNNQATNRLTGGRLPAMTWNRFMTYAHQNIDIRPLPFVEPEKPSTDRPAPAANPDDAPQLVVIRQKPLPKETADILRRLELELRQAPPLKAQTLARQSATQAPNTDQN